MWCDQIRSTTYKTNFPRDQPYKSLLNHVSLIFIKKFIMKKEFISKLVHCLGSFKVAKFSYFRKTKKFDNKRRIYMKANKAVYEKLFPGYCVAGLFPADKEFSSTVSLISVYHLKIN